MPAGARTKCQVDYIQGDHANFFLSCNGDCSGRYAGGVHIESNNGGGGIWTFWGHVDTASPYIGAEFQWGLLNPWRTAAHIAVDVVIGSFVDVF